jgi:4'-phosphopantetheinyl transferase
MLVRAVPAPGDSDLAFAHAVAGREVAAWLGLDPDGVRLGHACAHCGSADHGPLVAPGHLHVGLSRAPGVVVVAVTDAGPVGVDVERAGAADFAGFDGVALHRSESATTALARTRIWVRKEAVLKALRLGLRLDPRRLRVSAADRPAAVLGWESGAMPEEPVWLDDVDVPGGYQAAVAVISLRRPRPPV